MKTIYDIHYLQKHYFGNPHQTLIDYYSRQEKKGTLLDIGCGQGRNAIPLSRMGYNILGIDKSRVGVEQMLKAAKSKELPVKGIIIDMYDFDAFEGFDHILMDSLFHFYKRDRSRELRFLKKVIHLSSPRTMVTLCIHNTSATAIAIEDIIKQTEASMILDILFAYTFAGTGEGNPSTSNYRMVIIQT